jgi:pyrrolidone-carboxylate peptidase
VAAERVSAQPGRPLDGGVRRSMEGALGHDFSAVRVHTDPAAGAASARLDASAFTVGEHIGFAADAFRPAQPEGRSLLGHELIHVVQQRAGGASSSGAPVTVDEPGSSAEATARAWHEGPGPVSPRAVAGPVVQRAPKSVPPPSHITDIWVHQAGDHQHVDWKWSGAGPPGGGATTAICSAGKGHCCVDSAAGSSGPACSDADTRAADSNYTPTGEFTVTRKGTESENHPPFWTQFVDGRSIALHQYRPVTGTPLSHGCVRLDAQPAKVIYDGSLEHVTKVHVDGLPTPRCSTPELQAEWQGDFALAGKPPDGEKPEMRAEIKEARKELKSAFGAKDEAALDAQLAAAGTNPTATTVAPRIPRCVPQTTVEEAAVTSAPTATVPPTPGRPAFVASLTRTPSLDAARAVVRRFGQSLWDRAKAGAQAKAPGLDDRPLYWGRLRASAAIRQWQPSWTPNPDVRRRAVTDLLQILEHSSRGLDTFTFPAPGKPKRTAPGTPKRIVVSGFDPFGFKTGDVRQSNPSASAALALDGTTITTGTTTARIEAAIFPVRYRDFDAAIVENAMRPHLVGPPQADFVMTISRGGSDFELEELAGRRRSAAVPDNAGVSANPTQAAVTTPIPGGTANPEFIRTNVSATTLAAARGTLGRRAPLPGETVVQEVKRTDTSSSAARAAATPTPGQLAFEGSGGGFLSNEIFYRTSRLRVDLNVSVPVIHLHVPGVTDTDPEVQRAAIVTKVRTILEAAVPTL